MQFVSVSFVLYSFPTGFIFSRSINDSDMYKPPEPVSKRALHLTQFTFIIATGYVTLVSVVTNIGLDFLAANLSHIDAWCLKSVFKSAQYFSTFSHGFFSFTVRRSIVRFLTIHTFILSFFSLVSFAIAITFFWILWITHWYTISHSPFL